MATERLRAFPVHITARQVVFVLLVIVKIAVDEEHMPVWQFVPSSSQVSVLDTLMLYQISQPMYEEYICTRPQGAEAEVGPHAKRLRPFISGSTVENFTA